MLLQSLRPTPPASTTQSPIPITGLYPSDSDINYAEASLFNGILIPLIVILLIAILILVVIRQLVSDKFRKHKIKNIRTTQEHPIKELVGFGGIELVETAPVTEPRWAQQKWFVIDDSIVSLGVTTSSSQSTSSSNSSRKHLLTLSRSGVIAEHEVLNVGRRLLPCIRRPPETETCVLDLDGPMSVAYKPRFRSNHIHQCDDYVRFARKDATTTVFTDHRKISIVKESASEYQSQIILYEHIVDIKIQGGTLFVLTLNKILMYALNDLNLKETVTLSSSDYGRIAVTCDALYITREYEGMVLKYHLSTGKLSGFVTGFDRPRAITVVDNFSRNVVIAEDRIIHVYRPSGVVQSRFNVYRCIFDVESIDGEIYVLVRGGVDRYAYE